MIQCAACEDILSTDEDLEPGHFALCTDCDAGMTRCKQCGEVFDWQGIWIGEGDDEIAEMLRKGLLICPGCDHAAERAAP